MGRLVCIPEHQLQTDTPRSLSARQACPRAGPFPALQHDRPSSSAPRTFPSPSPIAVSCGRHECSSRSVEMGSRPAGSPSSCCQIWRPFLINIIVFLCCSHSGECPLPVKGQSALLTALGLLSLPFFMATGPQLQFFSRFNVYKNLLGACRSGLGWRVCVF